MWPLCDYQEIICDLTMITKSHTPVFRKSFNIYVFIFFSIKNDICDSRESLCGQPKDPNVQNYLQSWAPNIPYFWYMNKQVQSI